MKKKELTEKVLEEMVTDLRKKLELRECIIHKQRIIIEALKKEVKPIKKWWKLW
jgi:hypothetical protein